MAGVLLRTYKALWKDCSELPDVFAYLEAHPDLLSSVPAQAPVVEVLLVDQRERWRRGEPLLVEDYLERLPQLCNDDDLKLCLAVGEFKARQRSGSNATIDEFTKRFSELRDTLRSALRQAASGEPEAIKDAHVTPSAIALDASEVATKREGVEQLCKSSEQAWKSRQEPSELTRTVTAITKVGAVFSRRYRLIRVLGEGGFGTVFLAVDEELHRQVAIKVPKPGHFRSAHHAESYLAEARTVAGLDHPHIVPVFDVGRTDDGSIYIVSKYIEGVTLADLIKDDRPDTDMAASLMATVSLALDHAHQRRLIHRDIKPSNILIDERTGTPYVADFGLAIKEEEFVVDGGIAGTAPYMSPEQARGEGHRLDGRSDLFSVGIVFYELLTGQRPFGGGSNGEILHQIKTAEPRPPRYWDESIPAVLERICLRALSKQASQRYRTGKDLAEELLHWNRTPNDQKSLLPIVPKGLRSFDAQDAAFFLDLLPGPRNADGLPESVQFWKRRIEETEPDKTFAVGLIYGPSGCGKSSLVKAGLLPQISTTVAHLYVEASPDDTESRILRGLGKKIADLPDNLGLVETFAWLRRDGPQKVVIVIDQFEQWLHAHRIESEGELVTAMRQCDGAKLQAIVMVRDDFGMAATRFMDSLDLPLRQGENFATIDLFDQDHARKVLVKFGQAYGKLPPKVYELSDKQQTFVDTVASRLARNGKVVSVRLALFAEMIKAKPWEMATLGDVGGAEGVGVNFLEETFTARSANPRHRLHQQAARRVLKCLLPESGTSIKGHMRSHDELLDASGYSERTEAFDQLLRILDAELRLITPTDPDELQTDSEVDLGVASGSQFYQLTHDYMVPSLRTWLTRKQRETRKGRAELTLAERAEQWSGKPETRYLPSPVEWANIRTLTEKKQWTEPQRAMMAKAGRLYGLRSLAAATVLTVLFAGAAVYQRGVHQRRNLAEAKHIVSGLLKAETSEVKSIVAEMAPYRDYARSDLEIAFASGAEDSNAKLHAALAMLQDDISPLHFLNQRLLEVAPEQFSHVRDSLEDYMDLFVDDYWRISCDEEQIARRRFQAACALASYDRDHPMWHDDKFTAFVAGRLVSVLPSELVPWRNALRPVKHHLAPALGDIFRDKDQGEQLRGFATDSLAEYLGEDIDGLLDLLLDADANQFEVLFDALKKFGDEAITKLNGAINETSTPNGDDLPLNPTWPEVTDELALELQQADGMVAERFAVCQTLRLDDLQRIANELSLSGYRPIRLRPYSHEGSVRCAVAWTRDGREWRTTIDAPATLILQRDKAFRNDDYAAVDAAGYLGARDGQPADLYAGLWVKHEDESENARIYVAVNSDQHKEAYSELNEAGFDFQHSLQGFRGVNGQPLYCGVRRTQANGGSWFWNQTASQLDANLYGGKGLWDVDLSRASEFMPTSVRNQEALANAEASLQRDPQNLNARFARGRANFFLDRNNDALADIGYLIQRTPAFADLYRYRAVLYARIGNADAARADLEHFADRSSSDVMKTYLDVIVSSYLGDEAVAINRLERLIENSRDDERAMYDAACAYSISSGLYYDRDVAKSKVYADRAVTLLIEAVATGYADFVHMHDDPDLDPIRGHEGFRDLMNRGNISVRFSAVWNESTEFEFKESHGKSPTEHLRQCKNFEDQGFRPVSVCAASIDGAVVTASVWHRRRVSNDRKETTARRRALAATALLRIGAEDNVWALFKHSPDPLSRSWLIHLIGQTGSSPKLFFDRLREETDDSIRRALLLAVGSDRNVGESARLDLVKELVELYKNDPDPGTHAAAEWTLRRWDQHDFLGAVDKELATGKPEGQRGWYVTKTHKHTMAVVPGPSEFVMGSDTTEQGRDPDEATRLTQIPRTYAIASKEVTLEQFRDFLSENSHLRWRTLDRYHVKGGPALYIDYLIAMKYCRWLSQKEGIPDSEMCYPPISEIGASTRLPSNYLQRTGYRLPTEAEWEFACRANATTSRYFGDSVSLLGMYAHFETLGSSFPVARLKPNDFGLFDTLGNAWEWCQFYDEGRTRDLPYIDKEQPFRKYACIRGAAYNRIASVVRCADRWKQPLTFSNSNVGFRICRTLFNHDLPVDVEVSSDNQLPRSQCLTGFATEGNSLPEPNAT